MFVLQPKPTFKGEVVINTFDGEGKITLVFKHKGRKALKEFFESVNDESLKREEVDVLLEIVQDWQGVDTKFSREALADLIDNYPGSGMAILTAYSSAVFEGRAKN